MAVKDITQHPEYQALLHDINTIHSHIDSLAGRAPDPYWAGSAKEHLLRFEHAYRRAFHDLPASEKTFAEDLF